MAFGLYFWPTGLKFYSQIHHRKRRCICQNLNKLFRWYFSFISASFEVFWSKTIQTAVQQIIHFCKILYEKVKLGYFLSSYGHTGTETSSSFISQLRERRKKRSKNFGNCNQFYFWVYLHCFPIKEGTSKSAFKSWLCSPYEFFWMSQHLRGLISR